MRFGPFRISRPPSATPGTGSRRQSMPGMNRPAVPALNCMGVLTAITGDISVAP